jgi:hypothetical protein
MGSSVLGSREPAGIDKSTTYMNDATPIAAITAFAA